jgi:hypothetical protein
VGVEGPINRLDRLFRLGGHSRYPRIASRFNVLA